jgi:cytoskeleton protein RodZ
LPSFGERLKLEREKRKITLEQISASTKIGIRMLQALEEDKFDQLPGGIFNKGFVRAYARFVGLDEDQTVADYLEASGDAPPVSTAIAVPEDESRENTARENAENVSRLESIGNAPARELPWGLFAAVLLVVALTLSLWSRHQREQARQSVRRSQTTASTPSPSEQLSGNGSGEGSGEVPNKAPVEDTGAGLPSLGSRSSGSPNSASPSSPKTSSSALPKPQGTAPQDRAPAATPGQFTVVVEVREESWVSITADGRTLVSQVLAPGSTQTVRGRKEIIVRTGNAAGVGFLFNGKKLDLAGESGQVKTVTFGPEGIAPNAAEGPVTP